MMVNVESMRFWTGNSCLSSLTFLLLLYILFCCSSVQGQAAHPHHSAQPPCPPDWWWGRLHRLYTSHPIHRQQWHASHHAVRGDTHLAPPRQQVAECPLPPLWLTDCAHQVRPAPAPLVRLCHAFMIILFSAQSLFSISKIPCALTVFDHNSVGLPNSWSVYFHLQLIQTQSVRHVTFNSTARESQTNSPKQTSLSVIVRLLLIHLSIQDKLVDCDWLIQGPVKYLFWSFHPLR